MSHNDVTNSNNSNSNKQLLQQTMSAILSVGNRVGNIAEADAWLVSFEKSTAAWEIAEALLWENSNPLFTFFGAKFLYSKAQKQFFQLDENSSAQLTQVILRHIIRLSTGGPQTMEMNVCRFLCLAVATLALQCNTPGIISEIFTWLNPIVQSCPIVLLELLTVLPEEAFNRQVDVSQNIRDLFVEQLNGSSAQVLAFVSSLWPTVSTRDRLKILSCSEKWINAARIPMHFLQGLPIYSFILQTLQSPAAEDAGNFEAAVDALLAVLFNARHNEQQLLANALPVILSLRKKWLGHMEELSAASSESDRDIETVNACRILSRLFSETAEICMDMLFLGDASNATAIQQSHVKFSEELIYQLLECAQFPYTSSDPSISRMPLNFFYNLGLVLSNSDGEQGSYHPDQATSSRYRSELLTRYLPVYECLLQITVVQMRMPESVFVSDAAIPDDISEVRACWKEVVVDCCSILGIDKCMNTICNLLQNEISSSALSCSRVESILYSVELVSEWLPRNEEKYVPPLIEFMGQLSESNQALHLQITLIELYGLLSFWFVEHPQVLGPVMMRLFNHLSCAKKSLTAARTLMNILRHCRNLPGLPVTDLYSHIQQLRMSPGSTALSVEAELLVLEGIAVVVSSDDSRKQITTADSEAAFRSIVQPIVDDLRLMAPLLSKNSSSLQISTLISNIDRLTMFFRFYRTIESSCVVDLLVNIIPLFKQLNHSLANDRVAEHLCRTYKHAIRNVGLKFLQYLPAFTTHLTEEFAAVPVGAFLYAASSTVGEFTAVRVVGDVDISTVHDCLYNMVWGMSTIFFNRMPSLEHFEQKPDIVEEYFFFMGKVLQCCPAQFVTPINSAGAHAVLEAGISGLVLKHREAQKGILQFFERLVQLVSFWAADSPLAMNTLTLVNKYAPSLINTLLIMLSGHMPAYALDESNGCIADVLWYLRKRLLTEFRNWIVQLLPNLSQDAQAIAKQHDLVNRLTEDSATQKSFAAILDRFAASCRRSI